MNKKVLIVDDSEYMRAVVSQAVELIDLEHGEAENGLRALEKLKTDKYDLLITDINMPEMDGLSLIKETRKLDENIPILVLTTESEDATRKEAMQAGANSWITKPFEASQILNIIKELLD
jgi:two-component system, chemotaxis family, chemotaxis protein CheY